MIETEASPILCAAAVVRHPETGNVLMLRRHRTDGYDPWDLNWCLPGGRVEWGDSPEGCAEQWLLDRVGVRIDRPLEVLGVSSRIAGNVHLIGIIYRAIAWHADADGPHNADPQNYDRLEWVDPRKPPGQLMPVSAEVLQWLSSGRVP